MVGNPKNIRLPGKLYKDSIVLDVEENSRSFCSPLSSAVVIDYYFVKVAMVNYSFVNQTKTLQ